MVKRAASKEGAEGRILRRQRFNQAQNFSIGLSYPYLSCPFCNVPHFILIVKCVSVAVAPAEYIGKDVAVVALDNMLAAYYEGKQIALHAPYAPPSPSSAPDKDGTGWA